MILYKVVNIKDCVDAKWTNHRYLSKTILKTFFCRALSQLNRLLKKIQWPNIWEMMPDLFKNYSSFACGI